MEQEGTDASNKDDVQPKKEEAILYDLWKLPEEWQDEQQVEDTVQVSNTKIRNLPFVEQSAR
jgi:hypothetical protein